MALLGTRIPLQRGIRALLPGCCPFSLSRVLAVSFRSAHLERGPTPFSAIPGASALDSGVSLCVLPVFLFPDIFDLSLQSVRLAQRLFPRPGCLLSGGKASFPFSSYRRSAVVQEVRIA